MPRPHRVFKAYIWTCGECGRDNAIGRLTCATCRKRRPDVAPKPASTNLKFGNRWTEYGGINFQSAREANYCAELDFLKRAGQIIEYRRQVPIALVVNDQKICKFVVDFEVRHRDGSLEYVEVKGYETPAFKIKWKLFEALFPNFRKAIVR